MHEEIQHPNFVRLRQEDSTVCPDVDYIMTQLKDKVRPNQQTHYDLVYNDIIIGILYLCTIGEEVDDLFEEVADTFRRASGADNTLELGVFGVSYPAGYVVIFRREDRY